MTFYSKAGAIAEALLDRASAEQIVFNDKKTEFLEDETNKKPLDQVSSHNNGDTPITPKDFYWDQILLYLVSAILGLSFLNTTVEFFRGSTIHCYISDTGTSLDQVTYLNNYCYSSLPNSQHYLIFTLISALIIIAPHYLWASYFGAYFDFFFDLTKKLHRLRDTKTGEYNSYNFELVKKLEQKFSSNPWMFRWYKLKLLTHLVTCTIFEIVNAFYFEADDFNKSFPCPADSSILNTTVWPLPEQLNCVYNSLTLLYFLRNTALGLVAAAIVVIMIGLVWCFLPHTTELGAKDIAAFCDFSCLPPEEYTFPSLWKVVLSIFSCAGEERIWSTSNVKQVFSPRIHTDLDFLVTRLFYSDSGHGQVFKEIQILKELEYRSIQDHKLMYLLNMIYEKYLINKGGFATECAKMSFLQEHYKDIQAYFLKTHSFDENNIEQSLYFEFKKGSGANETNCHGSCSTFKSEIFRFFRFAPRKKCALDISFGNRRGHSLILARAFSESLTIHFNKYYKDFEEVCHKNDYHANYYTLTLQNDIYGQNADSNAKSDIPIVQFLKSEDEIRTIDLITVGPITEYSDIITTNILLHKIHRQNKYFTKKAILLAIRPLEIGFEQRSEHFIQYIPPQRIFKCHSEPTEKDFVVECNNVQCVYEFKMYCYTGNTEEEQVP
ncbi:PREDICTED: uncharacterized protein LOC109588697 [Amphimedon queenslandica]|uniref:Innexin n=1 Tax=Amphimedon queenslandica TaxID=400682 RepID=A0A1X7TBT4_AMPQE|nr:PREDICTED: uncharacterized protein LOC109588697 [Amphimedon queenslandica]|eukprot:XP_019860386.1 PREDICTED: uncharacterized protein LOC109588697 [Amphimedon queenslandica]